ncbi:hypothetical protein [Dickeya ananatis]
MLVGDASWVGQRMEEEGNGSGSGSQSASADDVNSGWSARQAGYSCL